MGELIFLGPREFSGTAVLALGDKNGVITEPASTRGGLGKSAIPGLLDHDFTTAPDQRCGTHKACAPIAQPGHVVQDQCGVIAIITRSGIPSGVNTGSASQRGDFNS